jgi:hypothetical protein
VAGGHVIWADGGSLKAAEVGAATGPATVLGLTNGFNSVTGFVVRGEWIYLGEDATTDSIQKVPLKFTGTPAGPQTAEVIPGAGAQMSPSQFATDEASLYFATKDCRIMRLAP